LIKVNVPCGERKKLWNVAPDWHHPVMAPWSLMLRKYVLEHIGGFIEVNVPRASRAKPVGSFNTYTPTTLRNVLMEVGNVLMVKFPGTWKEM
jgi:hypothetical protein